jgi:hypothetical protein
MNKLILTFLLTPLLTFAQDNSEDAKLTFGIFALPEMNGLITNNPIGTETVEAKISSSVGLNVEYHLTEKVSLRSGLGFGVKRYDHTHEGLIFNSDLNPQSGQITESRMESKVVFSELQLPLLFQYKIHPNLFFTLGLEVNAAVFDQSERIIYYGNGDIEQLSNQAEVSINFAPMISVGYVVPNSNLMIEPMFKYYTKSYIIAESHLFNYGVKVTYNWPFWK